MYFRKDGLFPSFLRAPPLWQNPPAITRYSVVVFAAPLYLVFLVPSQPLEGDKIKSPNSRSSHLARCPRALWQVGGRRPRIGVGGGRGRTAPQQPHAQERRNQPHVVYRDYSYEGVPEAEIADSPVTECFKHQFLASAGTRVLGPLRKGAYRIRPLLTLVI